MKKSKPTRAERSAAERKRQRAAVRRDAQGRVHLEVRRDAETGRPRLALLEPIFENQWQNEVAVATANSALGTLRDQPTVERTLELARYAMAAASELSDSFLARLPEGTVACKAGCSHCCHQVVTLTAPEALAVVDHLRRTRSEAQLTRIEARVADAHERARGLTPTQRFSREHPCPFLEGGNCSIYEARPLACRGMNSRAAEGCAKNLDDSAERAEFLSSAHGGHSFAEPIRAFLAISAGLQLGLSEVYRLDMQPLELIAAVHVLLRSGQSLPARWISGQMPFESARAPEANEARLRELGGTLV